jgi:hypothetical protein
MTVVALTFDGRKVVRTVVTGPSSYTTGGFTVTIDELSRIDAVSVSARSNLKVANYVHVVDYSYTGADNRITFTVYRMDVTADAPSAWSEVPSDQDLSALTLEITAIGV